MAAMPAAFVLRYADRAEAELLSALCLRSKAFWGYDAGFIARCRSELMLKTADIEAGRVVVATAEDVPIGLAELAVEGREASLEKLFVEPDWMGRGVGAALFERVCFIACEAGAGRLRIESDPGATTFYRRMGAVEIGEAPSGSIPGRMLPLLLKEL